MSSMARGDGLHLTQTLAPVRALRIEFPDAIHHVTSRGDCREPVHRTDDDRHLRRGYIAQTMASFDS